MLQALRHARSGLASSGAAPVVTEPITIEDPEQDSIDVGVVYGSAVDTAPLEDSGTADLDTQPSDSGKASVMTWEQWSQFGVDVASEDRHRPCPQVQFTTQNVWRTTMPAINTDKLPIPHPAVSTSQRARVRKPVDRYGGHGVCAHNITDNIECDPPCLTNSHISSALPTSFMLKFFDNCHWGLVATKDYATNQHVDEYCGEMLHATVGEARRRDKCEADASYLHALLDEVLTIDAEHIGNAMRFINHVCVDPAVRYQTVWVQGRPRMQVLTNRPVVTGEELTGSYGFLRYPNSRCFCGHSWCRGFMGSTVTHTPHPGARPVATPSATVRPGYYR